MQIYRATLELLDYVFYATVERGKIYETGSFIHNYALAYAFQLAAPVPYAHQRQAPNYEAELRPLKNIVYLTPASPDRVSHRLVQWNTIRESYTFPSKSPSIGYPDWGFARVLRPESTFTFFVLVADAERLPEAPALRDALKGQVARIRLGKFPGKARINMAPATKIKQDKGDFATHTLLNWRDLSYDPTFCDVQAATLPTRLIDNAHFTDVPYYEAHFEETVVYLPAEMHFMARPMQ